jgi:hypothetical protein
MVSHAKIKNISATVESKKLFNVSFSGIPEFYFLQGYGVASLGRLFLGQSNDTQMLGSYYPVMRLHIPEEHKPRYYSN